MCFESSCPPMPANSPESRTSLHRGRWRNLLFLTHIWIAVKCNETRISSPSFDALCFTVHYTHTSPSIVFFTLHHRCCHLVFSLTFNDLFSSSVCILFLAVFSWAWSGSWMCLYRLCASLGFIMFLFFGCCNWVLEEDNKGDDFYVVWCKDKFYMPIFRCQPKEPTVIYCQPKEPKW